MSKARGEAHWRDGEHGRELVYADGNICGIAPYYDDFDKDKPCDRCGCRLGVNIWYDYDTKLKFHNGCYGTWLVEDYFAGLSKALEALPEHLRGVSNETE